jgi:hypothetical protein
MIVLAGEGSEFTEDSLGKSRSRLREMQVKIVHVLVNVNVLVHENKV